MQCFLTFPHLTQETAQRQGQPRTQPAEGRGEERSGCGDGGGGGGGLADVTEDTASGRTRGGPADHHCRKENKQHQQKRE